MICSLFDFCPQSAQSRRLGGGFGGLNPPKRSSKPPNSNMKHYKSVEFLSPLHKRKAPLLKTF